MCVGVTEMTTHVTKMSCEPWLECTRRGAPQGGLGKIRNRNRNHVRGFVWSGSAEPRSYKPRNRRYVQPHTAVQNRKRYACVLALPGPVANPRLHERSRAAATSANDASRSRTKRMLRINHEACASAQGRWPHCRGRCCIKKKGERHETRIRVCRLQTIRTPRRYDGRGAQAWA